MRKLSDCRHRLARLLRFRKSSPIRTGEHLHWRLAAAGFLAVLPAAMLMTLNAGAENDARLEADAAAFREALQMEGPVAASAGGGDGRTRGPSLEPSPAGAIEEPGVILPDPLQVRLATLQPVEPTFSREDATLWIAATREQFTPARRDSPLSTQVIPDPETTGSLPGHPEPPRRPAEARVEQAAQSSTAAASPASTQCLAPELQAVLADLRARFGEVTVVSTTHLNTDNHKTGGGRHRLHVNCKAVDFTTQKPVRDVVAYLRSRPEINGVSSYRNGVIHMDVKERSQVARRKNSPKNAPESAAETAADDSPSLFKWKSAARMLE